MVEPPSALPSTLEAEGVVVGLMDLAAPTVWGMLELRPEGDVVRFAARVNLDGKSADEIDQITESRIAAAVEAAAAANCGVAVTAQVEGIHRPSLDGGQRVTRLLRTSWDVRVLANRDSASVQRAAATAALVLQGGRPQDLHNVYLLGVRAMQTLAPIVGLWAFSAVVEEAHPDGKQKLTHALQLAAELRAKGYSIPPDPPRAPAAIRAAAVHSSPKSPAPTRDEVNWFRDLPLQSSAQHLDRPVMGPSPWPRARFSLQLGRPESASIRRERTLI